MLTKNFYNYVMRTATKKTITGGYTDDDGDTQDAYFTTDSFSRESIFSGMNNLTYDTSSNAAGVLIGSGTTPPTINDYMIENMITGFTSYNPSGISVNADDSGVAVSTTYGIQNTSTKAFTISEICLMGKSSIYSGSTPTGYIMIDRTVLEEPITINPSETKQVTYTIKLNYPTE